MRQFTEIEAIAAPMRADNIDTGRLRNTADSSSGDGSIKR